MSDERNERNERNERHEAREAPIDPRVKRLQEEDPESLKVLASIGRLATEGDAGRALGAEDLSDAEMASALLRLQDQGLITILADEESEQVIVQLNLETHKHATKKKATKKRRKKGRLS